MGISIPLQYLAIGLVIFVVIPVTVAVLNAMTASRREARFARGLGLPAQYRGHKRMVVRHRAEIDKGG